MNGGHFEIENTIYQILLERLQMYRLRRRVVLIDGEKKNGPAGDVWVLTVKLHANPKSGKRIGGWRHASDR